MSKGCQQVRFHCVYVPTDQSDETGMSDIFTMINKRDFVTTLALPTFTKKERRNVKVAIQSLSKKSACSLRSAVNLILYYLGCFE